MKFWPLTLVHTQHRDPPTTLWYGSVLAHLVSMNIDHDFLAGTIWTFDTGCKTVSDHIIST